MCSWSIPSIDWNYRSISINWFCGFDINSMIDFVYVSPVTPIFSCRAHRGQYCSYAAVPSERPLILSGRSDRRTDPSTEKRNTTRRNRRHSRTWFVMSCMSESENDMSSGSEPSESRRERVPYSRLATDALLADEPCNRIGDSCNEIAFNGRIFLYRN